MAVVLLFFLRHITSIDCVTIKAGTDWSIDILLCYCTLASKLYLFVSSRQTTTHAMHIGLIVCVWSLGKQWLCLSATCTFDDWHTTSFCGRLRRALTITRRTCWRLMRYCSWVHQLISRQPCTYTGRQHSHESSQHFPEKCWLTAFNFFCNF